MNRACVGLLVFATAGCGQLLGLNDFSDSPGGSGGAASGGSAGVAASAGSAGVGASAGSAGSSGSSGASGSGGGAGADAGITYSCSPATGEVNIVQDALILGNPAPESFRLAGDLTKKHGYFVLRGENLSNPVVAVGAVDIAGKATGLFTHSIQSGSPSGNTRTSYPGGMKVKGTKLEVYAYSTKGWFTDNVLFTRMDFPLDSSGALTNATIAHSTLASNTPCSGPESKFDNMEVDFSGASPKYALSCDESFSSTRNLIFGTIGNATTFSADGKAGEVQFAAAQLISTNGTNLVQTQGESTYRFGTNKTQVDQAFTLDLASAGTDTSIALGMAPTTDGKGAVILAGRFDSTGAGELRSGIVDGSKLAELGSKNPSFLTHTAPLMQDKVAGRTSYAKNGIFTAAPASAGVNVVLHWFGRAGEPRVMNYAVGKVQSGKKVTAVGTTVIEEVGADTQTAVVFWLEQAGTKYRVMARVITCGPTT